MNLEYLKSVVLPQRMKEIEEGKNLATGNPIYVVYSAQEHFVDGHTEYLNGSTTLSGKEKEYGYVDVTGYSEGYEFKKTDEGMDNPCPFTRFFTDQFVAIFLTSESAHDYLKYQSHNLNNPFVYVHHAGYANKEMDKLLEIRKEASHEG